MKFPWRLFLGILLSLLALALTACPSSGGNGGGGGGGTPSSDFTLGLNPTSLTVQQGSSGTTEGRVKSYV
ncbi:hypothetical protein TthAA22_25310 (plasmid) [Thermus thermophilus]|nr:hypothetical protein TthAA22_25310 [Thermus thermophilus]